MTERSILDLEDLARRYDAQVLREYLLEQELAGSNGDDGLGSHEESSAVVGGPGALEQQSLRHRLEGYDLRPRCFRRLRLLLVVNAVAYWSTVGYCGYTFYLRVLEDGASATPPLDVSLLGFFLLGTQCTMELAVTACLMPPARLNVTPEESDGLRGWDCLAWLVGMGARTAILLDVQVLALLWKSSYLLFLLSSGVFLFSIGIFVFGVQLRLLLGLFISRDLFAYDKPDLFFKGADGRTAIDGVPVAARVPLSQLEDSSHFTQMSGNSSTAGSASLLSSSPAREVGQHFVVDRPPPWNTIKLANFAHISDLSMLHAVLNRLYIPIHCQETQEFVVSVTAFSRCFCEDIVQCSVKFFFLMDCEGNPLVLVSFLVSAAQAFVSCVYSSTSSMDIPTSEDGAQD